MYGGDLFGDLPTAKSEKKTQAEITVSGQELEITKLAQKEDNVNQEQKGPHRITITNSSRQTTKSAEANKSKTVSLVGCLGNAGTATSFVPAALMRKRQAPTSMAVSTPSSTSNNTTIVSSTDDNKSTFLKKVKLIHEEEIETTSMSPSEPKLEQGPLIHNIETQEIIREDDTTTFNSSQKGRYSNQPVMIEEDTDNKPTPSCLDLNSHSTTTLNEDNDYTESQTLQSLHASVLPSEIYDPLNPNDYLTYKQQLQNEKLRQSLERQVQKTLEMQQKLREKIEEERKQVEASGDVNKIIEHRLNTSIVNNAISANTTEHSLNDNTVNNAMGRGRGRGRGMNNLPAWLVKKQAEQSGKDNETITSSSQSVSQFQDPIIQPSTMNTNNTTIPNSCTVLLSNMVGPGEVDDDLSEEVKEECEAQCGKVVTINIQDANETCPLVSVFVTFQEREQAIKAVDIFHGRMFDSRKISARIVNNVE